MLISSLFFLYTDFKSIFDRTMAWFDKFFVLSKKKLFYLKRSNFALTFIGSIHFTKNLSDHKILSRNWLANPWSSSKQTSQANKRRKILRLFMKKIGWPRLYVFLLKPFKAWTLKSFRLLFWPSFSTNN